MDAPLLSINIVSYNTKQLTIDCLRSILRSTNLGWITNTPEKDIEIVILDNGSSDGTQDALTEMAKSYPIPMKLVFVKENLGFGKGHNKAAKESTGELLLLLNTDTVIMKDAIREIVREYLSHNPSTDERYNTLIPDKSTGEKIHFLGPKLLNSDLSPQASCGPYYSIPVIFGALFLRGDHYGMTRSSPSYRKQVDWVSGACMICKRSYFEELNGFDENIFMYMEEIDLLLRARKKGMTVWFTPTAQIVHLGSASSNKSFPIYQVYRGFLYLYKKHHSPLELTMVQSILRLKSYLAILIGNILGRAEIVITYKSSLKILDDYKN